MSALSKLRTTKRPRCAGGTGGAVGGGGGGGAGAASGGCVGAGGIVRGPTETGGTAGSPGSAGAWRRDRHRWRRRRGRRRPAMRGASGGKGDQQQGGDEALHPIGSGSARLARGSRGIGGIRRPRLGAGRPKGIAPGCVCVGCWMAGGGGMVWPGGSGLPGGLNARGDVRLRRARHRDEALVRQLAPGLRLAGEGRLTRERLLARDARLARLRRGGSGLRRIAQTHVDHPVRSRDHHRVGGNRLHGSARDRVADPVAGDSLGQRVLQIGDRRAFPQDHAVKVRLDDRGLRDARDPGSCRLAARRAEQVACRDHVVGLRRQLRISGRRRVGRRPDRRPPSCRRRRP